ncbi:hypothetical protein K488DRAFT_53477 [Vararia minispora EC-137]|uniref:Uncharacterized protein n=1 Tax=Vararia minispora EC-137 TaxID=1314806 RepID=A0ACB8QGT9_9AGAM|nr:hypothetical protein K488DRAFT_53477 [Vararia minispora EC-137]
MSFDDGNVALLSGSVYFLVHRGVICRQSTYFSNLLSTVRPCSAGDLIDGRPALELEECSEDIALLLRAMYDGISSVLGGEDVFHVGYILLQLAHKYKIKRLQPEALDVLSEAWPSKLSHWDHRMKLVPATHSDDVRNRALPHPTAIINLARLASAPTLLPAAFYDLSRQPPSVSAAGFSDIEAGAFHRLSPADLVSLFQGRESASRFLSTFIVQVLEVRVPGSTCAAPQSCAQVFEHMAQEVVCDVGGVMCDPLRVMARILALPASDGEGPAMLMLCASCAEGLEEDVQGGREMLWDSLPSWFGVEDIMSWGA